MKTKGEASMLFEHFIEMMKTQFNKQVKKILSDNVAKFLSKRFQNFILQ